MPTRTDLEELSILRETVPGADEAPPDGAPEPAAEGAGEDTAEDPAEGTADVTAEGDDARADRLATGQRAWAMLLGAGYAALAVAVAWPSTAGTLAALAVLLVVEGLLPRSARAVSGWLRRAQTGSGIRGALRLLLLTLAVAQDPATGRGGALALLLATGAVLGARGLWYWVVRRSLALQRGRVRWSGLDVGGVLEGPVLAPAPRLLDRPLRDSSVLRLELLLVGAVLLVVLTGSTAWLPAAAALTVVLAAAFALTGLLLALRTARLPPRDADLRRVADAVAELAPEVVLYFSSPASGTYALRVWLEVLRALRRPPLVLLRERHHLNALDLSGLPVVVLPGADDVEQMQCASMRVALYPTNVVKNNHMIRLVGVRHAFIGHGDSDKAGSFSPITRVYDEIWVAGPAGRDRYLAISEGIRAEQIRQVGRPQLAHLHRRPARVPEPGRPTTVLYAPTWEGFYAASDYCSLSPIGVQAVRALVAAGRYRVLFKPHPASGQRRADVPLAIQEITELLQDGPHAVLPPGPDALYDAMEEADVLLTDVSSVLSDWLATGRPYLVTNPLHLPDDAFRARFPTAAAGAVVEQGGQVPALVEEAVGPDARAPQRRALAEYLLGPPREDPVADFAAEVDRFVAESAAAARAHP